MSMRPIDFQVTIPRSAEVARANNLNARGDASQQMFAQEFQKKVDEESKNVPQTNKTEGAIIEKDGKNRQQQNPQNKKDKKEEKEDKNKKTNSTSMYDISI